MFVDPGGVGKKLASLREERPLFDQPGQDKIGALTVRFAVFLRILVPKRQMNRQRRVSRESGSIIA